MTRGITSALAAWLERTFRASPRGTLEFLIVAGVFVTAEPDQTSLIVGGAISVIGELLRIWTAGYGYKVGEMSVRGPYRFVRHPYFLGTALLFFGLCVIGRDPWVMAGSLILMTLAYRRDYARDEARLASRLGPAFTEYRSRVPAFLPQLWPVALPAAGRSFSFENSLLTGRHRELDAVLGLSAALGLLYLCYWLTSKDLFHLCAVGAVIFYVVGRAVYFGVGRRPVFR